MNCEQISDIWQLYYYSEYERYNNMWPLTGKRTLTLFRSTGKFQRFSNAFSNGSPTAFPTLPTLLPTLSSTQYNNYCHVAFNCVHIAFVFKSGAPYTMAGNIASFVVILLDWKDFHSSTVDGSWYFVEWVEYNAGFSTIILMIVENLSFRFTSIT